MDDEFNFENCIRHWDDFTVEFERRFKEVERAYCEKNLFNNSMAVEL